MITYISPREAELSRQIDEQGGHLVAWRDRAIAAEAELARLRAVEPVAPPGWREALQFYADGSHFVIADEEAWDTVSGEPSNFWCDDGTATVEDGTVAKMALAGTPLSDEDDDGAAPPAQPAEPTIDEQVASVNAVFDAWRNGEDATLTLGLAAQPAHPDEFACPLCFDDPANIKPAEPVQRLSDERAAFEAWHNEYRTQELVRRDDTYYNTHARCRWEGWQARAINSALQPQGWKCEIAMADFEQNTVTLLMAGDDYQVSAGPHMLVPMLPLPPKATK